MSCSSCAIPRLHDAFALRASGGVRIQYLVQDFVPGVTLADALAEHRFDEAGVLAVVEEVSGILGYLHGLSPPVVHRDVKPRNLMRRPDGTLVVIDFGTVKDALSDPRLGGSTIAGTFGFMAPEQFQGDAEPRSDVYGLGVTAIALLTRCEPRELVDRTGRLQWRDRCAPSDGVGGLLAEMTATDPAARPSARTVQRRAADLRAHREPPALEPPRPVPVDPPGPPDLAVGTIGVGIVFLAALIVGMAVFLTGPSPEPAVTCTDDPCAAPGAFALRGLHLGQTFAEAGAAFPELALAVPSGSPPTVLPASFSTLDVESMMRAVTAVTTLPGRHLDVRTLVADTLASCTLSFGPEDRLGKVRCALDPTDASGSASGAAVRRALIARHGPPTRDGSTYGLEAEWRDASGAIELRQDLPVTNQGPTLEASSAAHRALVGRTTAEVDATIQRETEAARRAAEDARLREIEAFRTATGVRPGGL